MNCVLLRSQKGTPPCAGLLPSSLLGRQEVGAAGPALRGPQAHGHGQAGTPVLPSALACRAGLSLMAGVSPLPSPLWGPWTSAAHSWQGARVGPWWLVTARQGHCGPT